MTKPPLRTSRSSDVGTGAALALVVLATAVSAAGGFNPGARRRPAAPTAPPRSAIGGPVPAVVGACHPPAAVAGGHRPRRAPRRPSPPAVARASPKRVVDRRASLSSLCAVPPGEDDDSFDAPPSTALSRASLAASSSPARSAAFSALMALCGAALGPFLDSYHSSFGVLQYDAPIYVPLWGTVDHPALITSWWVPPLFGLAGFIIGWLYVLLDAALETEGGEAGAGRTAPTPPEILTGISAFTFQYWLSGVLYASGVGRTAILGIMSAAAALGFAAFDGTAAGLITSAATAAGGPLIEVGLISTLRGHGGYHYTDAGETGFFPLWIVPVYFLGGPAVGNLARGIWNKLADATAAPAASEGGGGRRRPSGPRCEVCDDTRRVGCPNCDARGYYVTYGREVRCNCCGGRGYVMCRACFDSYGDDPNDIEKIREIMSKMPD